MIGMGGFRLGSAARLSLVVLVAFFALALAAPAAFPGANGRIAFERFDNSNPPNYFADIFTLNPDGSGQLNLTPGPGNDAKAPRWSPDGQKLAFECSNPSIEAHICTMNGDGTAIADLGLGAQPAWSPDGQQIVFLLGNYYDVWKMNADGSNRVLLATGSIGWPVGGPDWGARGILFGRERWVDEFSVTDLWAMDADGTNQRTLRQNAREWAWSPDGTKIVLLTSCGGNPCVINADGTGGTPVPHPPIETRWPSWSPDGTKIVFSGQLPAPDPALHDIYTVNLDGTGFTRLTSTPELDLLPDWQPLPGLQRTDFKNAAQFCKAKREFMGEGAFGQTYGTGGNGARAFGKCVSADGS
jgi:TolB protein